MSAPESRAPLSGQEALNLLQFTELAVKSPDLAGLAQGVLPILVQVLGATAAVLHVDEPRPFTHCFYPAGMADLEVQKFKKICLGQFHQLPLQADCQPLILAFPPRRAAQVALFLLHSNGKRTGLLGLLLSAEQSLPELRLAKTVVFLLSRFIAPMVDRLEYEKKRAQFNAYFAVSSKIAKSMNLREVLEAVLYSSMEAVAAEAASVMLLDEKKKHFQFFGLVPPQPALLNAKFSARRGLAGKVLESQTAEVINAVQQDPRFYNKFDLETGFQTRNMVAIPLVAGKEKVGVLEVLNKAGGEPFQEEDRLLLQSIAEEIAFAIHDARLLEAKRALTAEIEKMHQFQNQLIQTSLDGIIANAPDGNILIFNEGAERILGHLKTEVMGKIKVGRLYPPGVAQDIRAKIRSPDLGGTGRLLNYETVALSKSGEQIPVELSASLIYENGREVATVGFFRDLRERKQLQEKLLHTERLAALGQMAAHISHEVKNPLMVIGGMARQVLRGAADEAHLNMEKLKIIIEEIRRLEDFLTDVGSFAKLSETGKDLVNLNSLVRELALKLEPSLQERNIKLSLNLAAKLPAVQFSPLHMSQVLLNIAKNSIEAMPTGGNLTFITGFRQARVFAQISDSGEGIPPDLLEKIFQPFYSTKPKGSGLGLAISKMIVEAHQGEIKVDSEPGQGTSVTVLFKASL